MTISSKFSDGAFVTSFGRSGTGKTVGDIASFPNAVVCAGTREFKPAMTVLGWQPPYVLEVKTLFDVEDAVYSVLKARKQKNKLALSIDAMLADDISVLSYQTEKALAEGSIPKNRLADKRGSGYSPWTNQKDATLTLVFRCAEVLRQEGMHLATNGHLRVARTDKNGKHIRGGIDLPMDLTEGFCAGTNLMARMLPEPERLFFQTIFSIENNGSEWATKNQFGLPALVPSNMRELLNAAGYKLSRGRGLEVHEEYVEQIAQAIAAVIGMGPYSRAALSEVLKGPRAHLETLVPDPRHVRWILRDASDRALIRREAHRSILGDLDAKPATGSAAAFPGQVAPAVFPGAQPQLALPAPAPAPVVAFAFPANK